MDIEFTWDATKARRNIAKHGVSFKEANQVFFDPHLIVAEDREDEYGELSFHAIGYGPNPQVLLTVVFVDRSSDEQELLHIIRHERQKTMSRKRTPVNLRKGIKITDEIRQVYEQRGKRLDNDPETRSLPPEKWAHAMRRDEFFRPIKKQTTVRIDADVLDWLKSKGEGHLTRINEILRERMLQEMERR